MVVGDEVVEFEELWSFYDSLVEGGGCEAQLVVCCLWFSGEGVNEFGRSVVFVPASKEERGGQQLQARRGVCGRRLCRALKDKFNKKCRKKQAENLRTTAIGSRDSEDSKYFNVLYRGTYIGSSYSVKIKVRSSKFPHRNGSWLRSEAVQHS